MLRRALITSTNAQWLWLLIQQICLQHMFYNIYRGT